METANIFEIKRFGTNDGAGIRTVIFLKGCPLRCRWCHNPEGISRERTVWSAVGSCVHCGCCIKSCPRGAVSESGGSITVERELCDLCGSCINACPTGCMRIDSKQMSVPQLMEEIRKDKVFYREGGGVTLSGGEPTYSAGFSLSLLRACRAEGINTSIETCLYADKATVRAFAEECDSIIADLKLADSARHEYETGKPNEIIIENIKMLAAIHKDVTIRVPLIPGHTADDENIAAIGRYISKLGLRVELINFNPLCIGKYEAMRLEFIAGKDALSPFDRKKMEHFKSILENCGLSAICR